MKFSFRWATGLSVLLLLGPVTPGVQAQVDIPATPTPATPTPAPTEPAPTEPLPAPPAEEPTPTPEPEPTPAPEPEPTPAPVTPTPTPTPTPPVTPSKRTAPMLISLKTNWPALVNNKKTTVPLVRTFSISGERAAQIRQKGGISASLDADLKRFVASLPLKPQDAHFEQMGTGWGVVQRNGLTIDLDATRANVLAMVQDPNGVQAAVVVTGQTAPKRTLDFFASKGITAFLASGQTSYYGSSPERVTNIHVGAANFKDRLFDGKTFSFNKMIGPVNARNGYVAGLVIAGDQTASGVGGGICQVSTTVFRALYGAGLPIVQRQNHSYQVHYYDPQGLDATIYQPSLDLRFANDTGGSLWFQTDWDDKESILTVSVFGQARDFYVQLDAPKTLSTTPSPKDRIIYDRTMPVGTQKQVDWAAPGAIIEVTRKFVRDNKVIRQDVLKSSYRPWPNIFRVGTKKA